MSRPSPRQSGLTGRGPIKPPQSPHDAPTSAQVAGAASSKPRKYRHKVSFYQDSEDTARLRAALLAQMPQPGAARTLTQFIDRAVMAEVQRLERELNDGKPFPGVEAGEGPRGRPLEQ